ncbi:MAG: hypothetical protein GW949_06945 [Spirochaetales bacterium]|nr:hypothetical protein [Spirochaetales bacterium]
MTVLLYTALRLGKDDFHYLADKMADRSRKEFGVLRPCPLCGSMLEKGQRVRTKVFTVEPGKRGKVMGITDSTVFMFGCPFCDPRDKDGGVDPKVVPMPGVGGVTGNDRPKRICPACGQELMAHDYVLARMFEQENKKTHVHVLGCTRCRPKSISP